MSDPSGVSESAPKVKSSCLEASEASGLAFAGKQPAGGGLGGEIAALAADGIRAGHVVTWIGATGNIVRFGRDGRPKKFGVIKE